MVSKGLGRGFDSLIPDDLLDEDFDPTAEEDAQVSSLTEIEIEKISPDTEQPRREFEEEALRALADSIREQGVLQPIVVTKEGDGYKIVAGERRWRASKMAGLDKIPAIVRSLDAQRRLELSIIENAQREDLNAIELAAAYAKLKAQFNLTVAEIAKRVGKSEPSIAGTIRLLALPDTAKKAMVQHKLSEGVMRPLIAAGPEIIDEVLPRIIAEGWTARKVEKYIAERKQKSSAKAVKAKLYAKDEARISEKYGAKAAKISGKSITISFKKEQELKDFLGKL